MILSCVLLLAACQPERRDLSSASPLTDPVNGSDARTPLFEDNLYRVSQGGRYFTWYGCGACHGLDAKGPLNLADNNWIYGGGVDQVFHSIADGRPMGMPAYRAQAPQEELWELTAYVRQLHKLKPDQRRRQDLDQKGEPQAGQWTGPVR